MRQSERPSFFSQAAATLAGAAISLAACGRGPRNPAEFAPADWENPTPTPPTLPEPAIQPVPVSQDTPHECAELKGKNGALLLEIATLKLKLALILTKCKTPECAKVLDGVKFENMVPTIGPTDRMQLQGTFDSIPRQPNTSNTAGFAF